VGHVARARGTSGGSAAALAAGLTPVELGSDIGGSIRNPAHFCGVYGHKPTHGIVPQRGHIPGPPGSLSEVDLGVMGPLARSASDLAAALDVLAGPDESRAVAWKLELPPPRRKSLRDYRVAAWLDDPFVLTDTAVRKCFDGAVAALRKAGVKVDDRARPIDDLAGVNHRYQKLLWPILSAGLPPEQFEEMARIAASAAAGEESAMVAFARAATIRHREWLSVNEWREHYRARWAAFFKDFDVLLCPITPTAAILHDHTDPLLDRTILVNGKHRPYGDLIVWAGAVTMALLPATVAPVGKTAEGLPVGIQIVGPWLEDRTTIDFAERMGDVVGGFEPPPGFL
jgi:amidase